MSHLLGRPETLFTSSDAMLYTKYAIVISQYKVTEILYEQRVKIFNVVKESLNRQIQKGFFRNDVDTDAIAFGLVALHNALAVSRF